MYHAVVRSRIRKLFDAVNSGDGGPVVRAFASRFRHVFLGMHALGGERTSVRSTEEWYRRLFRLLPDIHFDILGISVSGPLWNTLVIVEWNETNSGTDGVTTHNHSIHAVTLSWGKMTQLFICPDTAALEATLDRLASKGTAEAKAPPITG